MQSTLLSSLLLSFLIFYPMGASEIIWWHAMGGTLGDKVNEIAMRFNQSQQQHTIKPIYKGDYTETMTGAIAAFRTKNHPHIVQIWEVGTATMMSAKKAIYPAFELMKDMGTPLDPNAYLEAVTSYYTDPDGNMLSLPFNSSTPVLYYNKEAFRLAGLDPERGPKTWDEFEDYAKKLQKAGYPCGFTTGYQSWTQLENFSAWHDLPFATMGNGFDGLGTSLALNSADHIKHITKLAQWQQTKIFDYGGRKSDAAPKFYNGECAMYMNSSASYSPIRENVRTFQVGVSMLPYWEGAKSAPQNSIIGGASLWVLRGHKPEEYKGVAKFFSFLSSSEVQADWHQFTGYLPITHKAYKLSQDQGYYAKNPGTETAIKQLTLNKPTVRSKGIRLGNFVQIRDVINEELEAIWAGKKDAKSGLQSAVERSEVLLRKFERTNGR